MFPSGLTTDNLVRIAAAGGGMRIPTTGRTADDLVRIAAAARTHGARVIFSAVQARTVDDLVRIAAAGRGCVSFEGD